MREALETDGPVAARRARHQGGELLPDDPGRRRRAGHGGLSAWASRARKELLSLEDLEAAGSMRTGRKHVLSILVENKPGVLARIAGLFARRGFNIDTLAVGPTDDPSDLADHAHRSTAPCTRSTRSPSSSTSWST